MSIELPESLVIEILSWLPVNSLLRFKRLNKSWYKIIKSPYFISRHLKHGYGRRTNCFIALYVVRQAGLPDDVLQSYMLWHGKSYKANIIHDYNTLQREPPYNYDICGPCYGIYYLWRSRMGEHTRRLLWNPALNEIKNLPPMIMKPNISSNMKYYNEFCGSGFDPVTVDYKVVVIMGYSRVSHEHEWEHLLDCPLSIMIYSLRTDSWKHSGDLSKRYYIGDNSCHTFVNRSLYWLGSNRQLTDKYDVIIAVDFTTEECQEIGLPDKCIKEEMDDRWYSEYLMVYKGSIALVALYRKESTFDIWTLKGSIWNKELTVELHSEQWIRSSVGHYCVDNNLVLFECERDYQDYLISCDPDTEETSKFELNEKDHMAERCKTVCAYMESLVPLNDRDFWRLKEDDDRENRNKCGYSLII